MHAAAKAVQRLHHGVSDGHLYLAVEFAHAYAPADGDEVVVYFCYPGQSRLNAAIPFGLGQAVGLTRDYMFGHAWHLQLGDRPRAALREAGEYGSWHGVGELHEVAFRTSLEAALPLARLGQPAGQAVQFVVAVVRGGQLVEVLPANQTLQFSMPGVEALA
jgi:hypothetical protein